MFLIKIKIYLQISSVPYWVKPYLVNSIWRNKASFGVSITSPVFLYTMSCIQRSKIKWFRAKKKKKEWGREQEKEGEKEEENS